MLNRLNNLIKSVAVSLSIIAAVSLFGALLITVYMDYQQCLVTAPAELIHMCNM